MKRSIYSNFSSFLSEIDDIDLIVVVNDARLQGISGLPIRGTSNNYGEDYDQFSIEELMELSTSELRSIDSFYALDNLLTAINDYGFDYTLTKKQKDKLSRYYKQREYSEVIPTKQELTDLLDKISSCHAIRGPEYQKGQPEKNFAEVHDLDIGPADYRDIIKSITFDEFISAIKSAETKRLGSVLYEFIHDATGYHLKYDDKVLEGDIKIYIKILPEYDDDFTVAIISFHDPLD